MNVMKLEYQMPQFDEVNVEYLLTSLGFNPNCYFFAMTKPSMLSRAIIGNVVDFTSRYAIVWFSDIEINLVMLSRLIIKRWQNLLRLIAMKLLVWNYLIY